MARSGRTYKNHELDHGEPVGAHRSMYEFWVLLLQEFGRNGKECLYVDADRNGGQGGQ